MRKAIKTLVITLLAVTAFILKPTDIRAEGTGKEYTHNFTTDYLTDSYFTITGKTTSGKGSVEYNGLTLTTALKMESSTLIQFEARTNAELTLVFDNNFNGYVKISKQNVQAENGLLKVTVHEGTNYIEKSDVTNLYYIRLVEEGEQETSSIAAEETSTPKETTTEKETVDDAAQITPEVTYGDLIIFLGLMIVAGLLISDCILRRL